ncbi:ABC transporter substrate-binding protein [Mameliella sp.]|uniref:ABC transporter substrate-binding protein n=1 Tax=Mameliella sp. TaxID=1924940 RepID=UPI003BA8BB16
MRLFYGRLAATSALCLFAISTVASAQPVTVSSCGMDIHVEAPVSAAVTLDQAATETLLGLNGAPHMAGTAYLKTKIAPQYRDAWESVPLLTRDRPTAEVVRMAEPDLLFAYSGFFFSAQWVGSREELHDLGVGTYISAVSCPSDNPPGLSSFDLLALDFENLGKLTGEVEKANEVIAAQNTAIKAASGLTLTRDEPIRVLWLYSVFEGTPYVAGGPSIPGAISDIVGVENVFRDVNEQWPGVSWEAIADREPDIIVLGDLSERGSPGDKAEEKIAMLSTEPGVSYLDAVKNAQYIVVPGIEMDPSIRAVNTLNLFVEGLKQLGYAE